MFNDKIFKRCSGMKHYMRRPKLTVTQLDELIRIVSNERDRLWEQLETSVEESTILPEESTTCKSNYLDYQMVCGLLNVLRKAK